MDIAAQLSLQLDPARILTLLGYEPDDWQAELLRSGHDRLLLNCSRQLGKSTAAGALALHTACFNDDALCLIVAPTERQSQLMMDRVKQFYRILKPVEAVREMATSLSLVNGSQIICLPGNPDGIRGFSSPRLVVLDEAARIDPAVLAAVAPMLVNGGKMLALTTPVGQNNWFYDAWSNPESGWMKIEARVDQCPRISPEHLEEQLRILGPRAFSAEFQCAFLAEAGQLFTEASIAAIFDTRDNDGIDLELV
jgi:hypothetical protein